METFEKKTEIPASAEELYDWHMKPGAFESLVPPWQKVKVVEQPERMEEGARLIMKVYMGPVAIRWVARHRDFIEGRQFVDEQVKGPFAHWVHTHRFEPIDEGRCLLHDYVEYRLPLGAMGRLFGSRPIEVMLQKMFEYRHRVTNDAFSQGSR